MTPFVSEAKEEGSAVINARSDQAVNEDFSDVGVSKGRKQLMFRKWKYADWVMILMWD